MRTMSGIHRAKRYHSSANFPSLCASRSSTLPRSYDLPLPPTLLFPSHNSPSSPAVSMHELLREAHLVCYCSCCAGQL